MKIFITICIILLIISQSNAQVDSDSIPTYETAFDTYLFNHSDGKEDNLSDKYPFYNYHYTLDEKFKILNCDGEKCKSEIKTYKSVEFEYSGVSYIATNAKVGRAGRMIRDFDGISYKLTGNPFLEKQYINGNFSHNNLYYPDGKPMEVTKHFEDTLISTTTTYNNNGEIISSINLADSILATNDKYGKYEYNRVNTQISSIHENYRTTTIYGIHPDSKSESIITHKDGTVYRGYPFIGKYHNLKNYELIGYLGIANSQLFGSGTVCFLKDNTTGSNYWAVILENAIVYKYEAKADEIPDIEFLTKNTEIDFKSIIRVNKKTPRYNSDEHFLGTLLNMKTKSLNENFSGYGIQVTTEETKNVGYGNKRFFEVGVYKNGKLHGAGFRLSMDIDYYNPYAVKVQNIVFNLKLEAGKFVNGLFVEGQKKSGAIEGNNFLNNDVSWLKPQPLENLDYSVAQKNASINSSNTKIEDFGFDFKDLTAGNTVYSTAAQRWFTVKQVDTANKKITLISTTQKDDIAFDAYKSGNLILIESEKSIHKAQYNCRHCKGTGIVKEKIYSNVANSHTYETGEMYISTSTGLRRGTKKYTATWYENKLVDIKKHTCPVCKGKKIFENNETNYKNRYIPVLF